MTPRGESMMSGVGIVTAMLSDDQEAVKVALQSWDIDTFNALVAMIVILANQVATINDCTVEELLQQIALSAANDE